MRVLLGVAMAVLLAGGTVRAQDGPGGGGLERVLLGGWHGHQEGPNGRTDLFLAFSPDGTFRMVTVNPRGTPSVMQNWGRFAVRQSGADTLDVATQPLGVLPRQMCMPGVGCQAIQGLQPSRDRYVVGPGGGSLQSGGAVLERSAIPPQLARPVPETLVMQRPAVAPDLGGGGGITLHPYVTPVDPSVGNHGDIQQRRICGVNDGTVVRQRDGSLRCLN